MANKQQKAALERVSPRRPDLTVDTLQARLATANSSAKSLQRRLHQLNVTLSPHPAHEPSTSESDGAAEIARRARRGSLTDGLPTTPVSQAEEQMDRQ